MPTTEQLRNRLVSKLRELFQLDQPDLDFGFYRIMHAKAAQVTAFLETDLLTIVEKTFSQAGAEKLAALQKGYEDAVAQARSFGAPDPEATEPVQKAKAALDAARDTSRAEADVYDHLYRFFERYYDDGDFISRRYLTRETHGKAAPFAIPYNGEEVKLHWANADQYYIKTTEHFSRFTFDLIQAREVEADKQTLFGGKEPEPRRVHFRIVDATEGEHGNVKASEQTKRYFIIHHDDPVSFEDSGELVCRFEFRPDPEKTGQEGTWRDKRNAEAAETILKALDKLAKTDGRAKEYLRLLRTPAPTDKQKDRPLLARYVNQYTSRNTTDYFIHKDLGGFLRRELDFYIKNEVVRLDDIDAADAPRVEAWLDRVRCLRAIAGRIIDFLAQLENFQKRLWLKKKFVTETSWCVSIGTILSISDEAVRDSLLCEIASNDAQRREWVDLHAIDKIDAEVATSSYSEPLTPAFLSAHPSLMVDTRHLATSLAADLLSSFLPVDQLTDGVLFHSENYQALTLIQGRYRQDVQCIYIDPPYNTDASPIIYKNGYRRSSWAAMIQDRMSADSHLRRPTSMRCVAIDDFEYPDLQGVLETSGREVHHATVVVRSKPQGRPTATGFSSNHEYATFWGSPDAVVGRLPRSGSKADRYPHSDEHGIYTWSNFRKSGTDSDRNDRRKSFYPVFVLNNAVRVPSISWDDASREWTVLEKPAPGESVVWPIDPDGREKVWTCSARRARDEIADIRVERDGSGRIELRKKYRPNQTGALPGTWWDDPGYSASESGTKVLKDLFGASDFDFPKSVNLVADCLRVAGAGPGEFVVDYFGGSGTTAHAVTNLNREDAGRRRFVLIEMGAHFDSVLLPRIKKVTFTPEWKDGRPARPASAEEVERGPRMFKVVRLESYEDCLNNLRLTREEAVDSAMETNPTLRQEYLLRYMLDVETKGSASLLDIDALADPTAYRLRVKKPGSDEYVWKNIDLIETFNYLLGLRVEHMASPQTFAANFEREADPELPKDQPGRLKLKGKLRLDSDGPFWFRTVEGWMPRNPATPNDGERDKVLVVWRKLTRDLEQDNVVLDEWFRKHRINPREGYDFDVIYVNGSNNLPNLKLADEHWRVRLIEEDFHRLMWDVEDV